jgi:hypothetical protein
MPLKGAAFQAGDRGVKPSHQVFRQAQKTLFDHHDECPAEVATAIDSNLGGGFKSAAYTLNAATAFSSNFRPRPGLVGRMIMPLSTTGVSSYRHSIQGMYSTVSPFGQAAIR